MCTHTCIHVPVHETHHNCSYMVHFPIVGATLLPWKGSTSPEPSRGRHLPKVLVIKPVPLALSSREESGLKRHQIVLLDAEYTQKETQPSSVCVSVIMILLFDGAIMWQKLMIMFCACNKLEADADLALPGSLTL